MPDSDSPIYDQIGKSYHATRQPDPRIVARIVEALDLPLGARLLDVGAGTGNYSRALHELGYQMTALEPSAVMRDQAGIDSVIAWVEGFAEAIPFPDAAFDGAILILSMHHFADLAAALAEVQRVVATGPIVIFTHDPTALQTPWLFHYFPAFREQIQEQFPTMETLREHLGPSLKVAGFPLPPNLVDGFAGAAWSHPEKYLDASFRNGISSFRLLDPGLVEQGLAALRQDLSSGAWDARFGTLRSQESYDHGYVFVTARGSATEAA